MLISIPLLPVFVFTALLSLRVSAAEFLGRGFEGHGHLSSSPVFNAAELGSSAAGRVAVRIRVTFIDDGHTIPELDAAVPFEADLTRQLPGPDRPDYWIAVLAQPIRRVTSVHLSPASARAIQTFPRERASIRIRKCGFPR